ncbi:TetR family transcriptional regulator [Nocardioides sp. GXQ0305]|uniref:TetR/AcrR family transcriptional regulator n=1 Tax=Nocardioides sp. GXQ0305 TaxID=3423912 RepID=UPI003D7CD6EC
MSASTSSPRGRRPGSPDTRAAILDAARARFAEGGFRATTIRAVAADAGVDAALVHHYFGTKDDLFLASLALPVDPRALLVPAVTAGGPEGAAERLLTTFLGVWDDPELQPALLTMVRGLMDPAATRLVSEGFLPVVLGPVGQALGIDRPEHRMPIVASQVLGVILLRYLVRVEPLASMPAEQVVATYAPTIQRYLVDPLP